MQGQGYLSEGQGFSEQGLLQQLTSSAGSGFTQAQAEYAISSLHPDWDAQAVDAAKGYMQMGGFSQRELDPAAHVELRQRVRPGAGRVRRKPGRPVASPQPGGLGGTASMCRPRLRTAQG